MGFTRKQRTWFLRVYNHMCHFPTYSEEDGWQLCGQTKGLHIHHVRPQRWLENLFKNPDYASNGIILCDYHHVGRNYQGSLEHWDTYVPVIHPDIAWALRNYSKNKGTFDLVMSGRDKRVEKGMTYWNTDFDDYLREYVKNIIWRYTTENPDDPFP